LNAYSLLPAQRTARQMVISEHGDAPWSPGDFASAMNQKCQQSSIPLPSPINPENLCTAEQAAQVASSIAVSGHPVVVLPLEVGDALGGLDIEYQYDPAEPAEVGRGFVLSVLGPGPGNAGTQEYRPIAARLLAGMQTPGWEQGYWLFSPAPADADQPFTGELKWHPRVHADQTFKSAYSSPTGEIIGL